MHFIIVDNCALVKQPGAQHESLNVEFVYLNCHFLCDLRHVYTYMFHTQLFTRKFTYGQRQCRICRVYTPKDNVINYHFLPIMEMLELGQTLVEFILFSNGFSVHPTAAALTLFALIIIIQFNCIVIPGHGMQTLLLFY